MLNSEAVIDSATNAKKPTLDSAEVARLCVLFGEIGCAAVVLLQVIEEHAEEAQSESYDALTAIAQKIGFLSDLGATSAGGKIVVRGAEEWFLPSSWIS